MDLNFESIYKLAKEQSLHGRYIAPQHISPLFLKAAEFAAVEIIGESVQGRPIRMITAGSGKTKVLMWSQMHGNEGTTTKAVFDFLNFLSLNPQSATFLEHFTFFVIPMLNPDGSLAYSRENANSIDLNRDFCNLTQPESTLLLKTFREIAPDFCFNLHDQRTIYGTGYSGKPATISFLAPAFNEAREVNEVRQKAIDVIVSMNSALQKIIPGQVGRFDDAFNINCVGDTFQYNNVPTILFEAGHHPQDYEREETRRLIFIAIVSAAKSIHENVIVNNAFEEYLNIPQNKIIFYDFVYKNVKINYDGNEIITNFAVQYQEVLRNGAVAFDAEIAEVGTVASIRGHYEFDAQNGLYRDELRNIPIVGHRADFRIGDVAFSNGVAENASS